MVFEIDLGCLGLRHPFRNMDKRSVRTLDNQERSVRTPVVAIETYRKAGQRMKTVMDRHLVRVKTGSMGLP